MAQLARHYGARPPRPRRWMLLVSVALALSSVTGLAYALAERPEGRPSGTAAPAPPRPAPAGEDWVAVLAGLDAARAQAFAHRDEAALHRVYTAGAADLEADRRLLRRYAERGLTVHGLEMEVVDLRLLARHPDRAVLRVRDRVVGGTVVDQTGRTTDLPDDSVSSHRITLVRGVGGWRIASSRGE
ncbi:MAG: hypothetical protein GEU96_19615 [Propionibacteriales bacterium]|nr:hypothetical protein [Propionibacteriales bacterium]